MAHIFITRVIPEEAKALLVEHGHTVTVSDKDRPLTKAELIEALSAHAYEGMLSLLTDRIDAEVMDSTPSLKVIANYAVGFDNIDLSAAKERGIHVTNTPDALTETVSLHAFSLLLTLTRRIVESDKYVREGKYKGWEPMLLLGMDMRGKTLGIVGAGRIGQSMARMAHHGFGMQIVYTDVAPNSVIEQETGATYVASIDELLPVVDAVSLHVPLLPETTHLMNARRLALMRPHAYLINTARGPVVDEVALVEALRAKTIAGAGLDVFEHEPVLAPGLASLENVVLTPHIASASRETRARMAEIAARNIIAACEGRVPPNAL